MIPGMRPTILVVDDEAVQRSVLTELLRFEGYDVDEATSGEQALEMCERREYALLLIDVTMPGMSGLELLREIRRRSSDAQAIMVSGLESVEDARRAMELGACSYISKPVTRKELGVQVSRALSAASKAREEKRYRRGLEKEVRTRTRQIQEALDTVETQRRELDTIVNSMHAGVVVVDTDNRITMINAEARRVFDAVALEAVGIPVVDLAHDERGRAQLARIVHPEAAQFKPLTLTVRNRTCHFAATVSPLHDARGNEHGKVIALVDQTYKTRMDEFRNSFLSIAAHELRTPLSVLDVHIANIRSIAPGNTEASDIHQDMREATRRLDYLVKNIITMAHLSVGRSGAHRQALDPSEILRRRLEALAKPLQDKELELTTSVVPHGSTVVTDPEALEIILESLLSNAVKFNRHGGKVTVDIHEEVRENLPVLRVSVEDTGVGIPPELREKIFGEFSQAEDSMTRVHEGAGLGLYLARRAAEILGGTVTLEDAGGGGSRFVACIPVESGNGREPVSRVPEANDSNAGTDGQDHDATSISSTCEGNTGTEIQPIPAAEEELWLRRRCW